jgi:hypothetical protein
VRSTIVRLFALGITITATAAVLLGCGGDGGDGDPTSESETGTSGATGTSGVATLTPGEFIEQADEICEQSNQEIERLEKQLSQTATANDATALFREQRQIADDSIDQLATLQPPEKFESLWERYLSDIEDTLPLIDAVEEAVAQQNAPEVERLAEKVQRKTEEANADLGRAGFRQCGTRPGEEPADSASSTGFGVGDTITFESKQGDLLVTVERVIDPVPPPSYSKPPNGTRYVGIELKIDNRTAESFSAALSSSLVTDEDREAPSATLLDGECSEATITGEIPAGGELVGCTAFEVPEGVEPATFQFMPGLIQSDTGVWDLTD